MENFDNSTVMQMLRDCLPYGSTILELGMGTGIDFLEMSNNYVVTGSDFSPIFVADFKEAHPKLEVYELDATDFSLDKKFDCIYSNKVLYHLSAKEFEHSLQLQTEHLNPHGIIFMTMWYGTYREELFEDDLRFTYYTESDIAIRIPKTLSLEKIQRYTEMEPNDSLAIILRKK